MAEIREPDPYLEHLDTARRYAESAERSLRGAYWDASTAYSLVAIANALLAQQHRAGADAPAKAQ